MWLSRKTVDCCCPPFGPWVMPVKMAATPSQPMTALSSVNVSRDVTELDCNICTSWLVSSWPQLEDKVVVSTVFKLSIPNAEDHSLFLKFDGVPDARGVRDDARGVRNP